MLEQMLGWRRIGLLIKKGRRISPTRSLFALIEKVDGPEAWLLTRIVAEGKRMFVTDCLSARMKVENSQERLEEEMGPLGGRGILVDSASYASLLRLCANAKALSDGKRVHAHIISSGYDHCRLLGNLLVHMYGKCGCVEDALAVFGKIRGPNVFTWNIMIGVYTQNGRLDDARSLFDKMPRRDVISWNAIIGAYAQHGRGMCAITLFRQMNLQCVQPDRVTFINTLDACASIVALEDGTLIHSNIIDRGLESDVVVGTALINMYGKCGNLNAARNLFCKMPQRNVVSWNSIIAAFAQNGHCEMALELYSQMELEGVKPDKITFIGILDACSSLAAVKKGKEIHASISNHGYESDVFVGTALVNMYGRCGSLADASSVFYKIPQRNIVLWTAMIAAYIHTGHDRGAIDLFRQMDLEGLKPDKITFISILDACSNLAALRESKEIHANIIACGFQSDIVLGNTLISMYGKCGSLEDAKNVFDNLPLQNVVSWNAMITAYAQNGHGKMALELFREMDVECVKSDQITFVSILDACAGLTALGEGKAIHANIVDGAFESDVVGNALVNMYGKCGSLTDARSLFDKMPHHNVVSWNSMISVYAQNGNGKAALELFPLMGLEGVKPDNITFIGILSACSHTGLLDDGCYQFISMSRDHLITPRLDHYVCMIDLLGRAGQFNEAEGLINSIPFEPHPVLWINLLGTCRIHGDVERGAQAAEHAFELDPNNTAVFVLLSNIYAAAGRWGDVAKVRNVMEDRRVKKQPGCSSIEIKGRVHKFIVRDTSHPQKEMIYAELQRLTREMEKAGYVPDSKALLHDVNEGKKEHMLYYHSEKLAIAFGFIVTPPGFPLHVIKNLRVCSDCHSAIKLISKIARRKITVRDASRFHHFDNGVCSCKDYW